jgi:hypothetical protein
MKSRKRFIQLTFLIFGILYSTSTSTNWGIMQVSSDQHTSFWNNTYGGGYTEFTSDLVQTKDGGFAIAGTTNSFGAGYFDMWLVKTDAIGNVLWNQTYGGREGDNANALVQTNDGGYALAGRTLSFDAGRGDMWLVKTDTLGNVEWNVTYGDTNREEANAILQTPDGGFILAGRIHTFSMRGNTMWLIKTDALGKVEWNTTFGGEYSVSINDLVITADGGYALAGGTDSFGTNSKDMWLIKTDSMGAIEWNTTYGGDFAETTNALILTSDNGFALAGSTDPLGSGNREIWLVKTDSKGVMLWNTTYGSRYSETTNALLQTTDGGYALAGGIDPLGIGSSQDMWLIKTDPFGTMLWNQTFGGDDADSTSDLVQTSDGGFAIAGATNSFSEFCSGTDMWLVKTNSSGYSAMDNENFNLCSSPLQSDLKSILDDSFLEILLLFPIIMYGFFP